ncbi:LysR family transcriptional regulator [Lysinibacillus sp. 38-6]|uniref:LysR family transcriptional regulator n=1 Tax=Lysinibacillus sp. 38-6 TaxID=3385991 RepID=UPI003908B8F2
MNLHALRIFTKVADLGSITAAANDLLLSQPAVTIQIRNLEKELGLKLTESKGRGIQLTEEGRFVYEQGLRLFHLEAQIEDKLKLFVAK